MTKHKKHKKKPMYTRDQSSGAKQWGKTDFFLCECGDILEKVYAKRNVKKINEKEVKDKNKEAAKVLDPANFKKGEKR